MNSQFIHIKYLFLIFIVGSLFLSCKKEDVEVELKPTGIASPNLPAEYFDYETENATELFTSDPVFELLGYFNDDGITNEGATLGRVLFYDKALSANNTIACASCHHQENAFADPNQFSQGLHGEMTTRNSMTLTNLKFNNRFFWDVRVNNLETLTLIPIQDPVEMDMNLDDLVLKLSQIDYYPDLFENAFGNDEITSNRISDALSQFIRSLRSYESKYDQGIEMNFANFSPSELSGKDLFFSGDFSCNHCHTTANVGGTITTNNGLDLVYVDQGQGGVNGNVDDIGKFKTPTLRNIGVTAPYMHDGRFATLEEVFNFYSTGINGHFNLDGRLSETGFIGGPSVQFNLTDQEISDMIAFLHTLTDENFITDVRYSDPFE